VILVDTSEYVPVPSIIEWQWNSSHGSIDLWSMSMFESRRVECEVRHCPAGVHLVAFGFVVQVWIGFDERIVGDGGGGLW